ncbi:FAD-binding domain-containing protein [Zymoseptoria brevis]|uniref:FAD-binding domain-containing protein n=1 Tax=Zymoseptoria brevis TaxID=1047168 RepID=A0A0F4GZ72_9PEZI|nr:FAD-binding domain-containing protein [Zymoseptoria brevis]
MQYLALLAGLLASTAAVPTSDTLKVCDYLYQKYPNFLAYDTLGLSALKTVANASQYTEINSVYWNNENSYAYRAACAFFPDNAEKVSDAVKQLNRYPSVKFGLKSGGHNPAPGFSAVDQGVLISFEPNLASTTRTADGNHFLVGPGAHWGDVYKEAGKTQQIVVGGRLGHIGVGGFVLGGGLSYYSAQYGLACDNVDNFEVVLADGTITNANRTSEPELFFSLRGGGNQFAIVTQMTMQAHPEGVNGQVWGGIRAYSSEKRHELFRAVTNFIRTYPDAKAAIIPVFQFGLPLNLLNAVTGPIVFFFYDGPTPPSSVFAEFEAITPLVSDTSTKSYYDLSQEAGGAGLNGFGNSFREVTVQNLPEDMMVDYLDVYWNRTYKRVLTDGLEQPLDVQLVGFTPQPVSVRIAEASQAQGGNALGLDPKNGDRIWIENQFLWASGPLCKERCPQYSKDLSEDLLQWQKKTYGNVPPTNYQSGDLSFINYNPMFMNDAAPDQDVYTSYGSDNLRRLQAAKKHYDPTGFFTNRQGGFKLPA